MECAVVLKVLTILIATFLYYGSGDSAGSRIFDDGLNSIVQELEYEAPTDVPITIP